MKRLLVIGASSLQLPAIIRAKEKGYLVAVADRDSSAIGVSHAHVFYKVSTRDIDGILGAAKDFGANGIITLATDMPMQAVANAVEELNLPGISRLTALKTTDKAQMIRAFSDHKVPIPSFCVVENERELEHVDVGFPCIIKPVDNSGSRGVILAYNTEQLVEGYKYSVQFSDRGTVIVEEYLEGMEVSVETMTFSGRTHILAITDKVTSGAPHFVELGHSQPSRLPKERQMEIGKLAIQAVEAVGLASGPAHVEIMVTQQGPKLIELGARMGGDYIASHLVPLSTGIDMVGATIDLLTGGEPDMICRFAKGSAIRYFLAPPGRIAGIKGIKTARAIDGVIEVAFAKQIGEEISGVSSSGDRIGFVIAQGRDVEEAVSVCQAAVDCISIEVT